MPLTATASTTIGAFIAIAASILNAIGYTLQKDGHNKLNSYNALSPRASRRKILTEKTWCIGFWIFILGGISNAIALYFAPQSLVLPLSAVTLVANTILATKILGEPFKKKSYTGIAFVMLGSILAVIFGPRTGGEHINITDLKARWSDTGFLIFFILLSLITVIDFIGIKYYERLNHLDETVSQKEVKYGPSFLLLSYAFQNGYFGSNAFLFVKAFTEFLGASFANIHDAQTALKSWYSYFILFCVVISNILFVMWQQRGLSFFPSVYVIPINQVSLIIMGTVLGGVYFSEFQNFSAGNATMFVIAIMLTFVGVVVLAAGHKVFDNLHIPLKVGDIMESAKMNECIENQSDSGVDQSVSFIENSNHYLAIDYKLSDAQNSFVGAATN